METSRRDFLKIGGVCALGLGALPVVDALGKTEAPKFTTNPRTLTAKRWGMVIDMKQCWEKGKPGCKDCVLACHSFHNVPDFGNPKDEIKWIWTDTYKHVFPGQRNEFLSPNISEKPFLVLCNQCANAPCVRVCPTQATFKRPNGITMIDEHRCIGCRFCMAACPFGARSFNFWEPRDFIKTELNPTYPTREAGVVEKCNFCEERLAMGSMPACVEACDKVCKALTFGDLEDPNSAVRKLLAQRFSFRRKPELGTEPSVFYMI
ncbi:MAG: 4Fe-4S dicluster domain-containing protein [Syntrophobacteraceae bacterium]